MYLSGKLTQLSDSAQYHGVFGELFFFLNIFLYRLKVECFFPLNYLIDRFELAMGLLYRSRICYLSSAQIVRCRARLSRIICQQLTENEGL